MSEVQTGTHLTHHCLTPTPLTDTPQQQAISEYLDQLCAQLSQVPETQQAELRRELSAHLSQVLDDVDSTSTLSEAVLLGRLVQEFGDPTTIGRLLAHPYHHSWRGRAWQIAGQVERCCWITSLGLVTHLFFHGMHHSLTRVGHPAPWALTLGLPLVALLLGGATGWRWPYSWGNIRGLRTLALICALTTGALASMPHQVTAVEFWLSIGAMGLSVACGTCAVTATTLATGGALWQRFTTARS